MVTHKEFKYHVIVPDYETLNSYDERAKAIERQINDLAKQGFCLKFIVANTYYIFEKVENAPGARSIGN